VPDVAIQSILSTVLWFYSWLIIVYVLLSYVPGSGTIAEIRHALGSIVEPYLGLFRRFIPPVGVLDISPMVAILVLWALRALLVSVL
jgi:YggT family protein